ncbi:hypothetical protein D0863_01763 [Hortaea werneckii]|uniref:Uncharacterized protein n=1 Tax=Hortaea werneckii TaxID=91943 RepID=A0A3M7EJ95_HORWE|nr:hypothetical protein D0863_01763 [Hortaea werneckii]
MPQALTPLGRQLRLVLANLPLSSPNARLENFKRGQDWHGIRSYHVATSHGQAAPAAVAATHTVDTYNDPGKHPAPAQRNRTVPSRTIMRKRRRRDYLTEALENSDAPEIVPAAAHRKHDISHLNVKSRNGQKKWHIDDERHAGDWMPVLASTKELRLERITANVVQHEEERRSRRTPQREELFKLATWEAEYLQSKGYTFEDVSLWASIVSERDSHRAVERLAAHNDEGRIVPIFVLLYLLRRPHLNARTLRVLLRQMPVYTHRYNSSERGLHIDETTLMVLFTRSLRHAREKWPRAIPAITGMFLDCIARVFGSSDSFTRTRMANMTHALNRAMHLIALPTSAEPYKEAYDQERALVRVLSFMVAQRPPLQLNREGYRAVIRVQLAQKKTPREQQWAELKALSWPPWKQERTAMDALITPEEHGLSRAGDTLRRMREAGYEPQGWEQVAQVLAGWDVDRTPTVQQRAVFYTRVHRSEQKSSVWAARITTTRTAQEAWAAYLAFEETGLESSEGVLLAIAQKLYQEERRARAGLAMRDQEPQRDDGIEPALPGEKVENEPLPPSTHLYTYTRRPIPSIEEFYRELVAKHVYPRGHLLGFLIANAASLQLGIEYLRSGVRHHPEIISILYPKRSEGLSSIPQSVFAGLIKLLTRFANVPLTKVLGQRWLLEWRSVHSAPTMGHEQSKHELNPQHTLVFALQLLNHRRSTKLMLWSNFLQALSHDATLQSLRFLSDPQSRHAVEGGLAQTFVAARSSIWANRLAWRVQSIMQDLQVDLDAWSFQAICIAEENVVVSCWKALKYDVNETSHEADKNISDDEQSMIVRAANAIIDSNNRANRLRRGFSALVGDDDDFGGRAVHKSVMDLPKLLTVPSAAILHAYIRSLGWRGDHQGLLLLVEWMVEHRSELAEQRARDRNGERLMRRAIIALRVFLERAWLVDQGPHSAEDASLATQEGDAASDPLEPRDARLKNLHKLEQEAPNVLKGEVIRLVEGVEEWHGWPSDYEVAVYMDNDRFQGVNKMYSSAK